jgi:hypothetical protein
MTLYQFTARINDREVPELAFTIRSNTKGHANNVVVSMMYQLGYQPASYRLTLA